MEWLFGFLPDPATLDMILLGVFFGPVVVLGIPLLRATIRLPRHMQIDTEIEVPQRVGEYFAQIESRLRTEGFNPVATFSVTNLPAQNVNRAYVSAGDAAVALATVGISDQEDVAIGARYVEFVTEFADGSQVATRSAAAEDPFDMMPGHHRFVHTRTKDPLALKQLHVSHCQPLMVKGPVHCPPGAFLDRLRDFHVRWAVFQEDRGLLRSLPADSENFGATAKLAVRGIATFFNPFAEGFTIDKLLLSLAFGIVAPVLAVATLHQPEVPIVPNLADLAGLSQPVAFMICAAPIMLGASAAVGWIFSGNALLWGFLAAYTSSRLLLPDVSDDIALAIWICVLFSAPALAQRVETFRTRRASS